MTDNTTPRAGRVAGKVAIVTGAASGLGAAYAATLAREGAQVVLTDVDAEGGAREAAKHPACIFLPLDVRDEANWRSVIAETEQRFGDLHILVNNAGLVRFATIEDCSVEDYRFINTVNAEGTFLGCKHAIPAMRRSGGGSIINTSSVAAIRGKALVVAYSASKGAIISMTRSIAAHCREQGYGIRCNAILPGSHETNMAAAARQTLPEGVQGGMAHAKNAVAEGRPEEAADLVLFLASDESRTITGTSMVIDGGQTIP